MPSISRQSASEISFDLRTDPPLKEFQFKLKRFAEGLSDFSGFFGALGEWFKTQMVLQFETQGAFTSGRWLELTEPYRKWKEAHYPGRKIGVLTGALRSSMTGGGGYSQHITKIAASFGMSENSKAVPYGKAFSDIRPVINWGIKEGAQVQKLTHTWVVAEQRGSMGIGGAGLAGSVRAGWTGRSAVRTSRGT